MKKRANPQHKTKHCPKPDIHSTVVAGQNINERQQDMPSQSGPRDMLKITLSTE